MKKIFLLFGLITFATLLTNAQQVVKPENGREKIKMLEIGYFTRQLRLSVNEAEKFWPLFNRYRQELKRTIRDGSITDELERQQRILDLRKKYRKDFGNVLDKERGAQVFQAEDNFKAIVRREIQQRGKMRQNEVPRQK